MNERAVDRVVADRERLALAAEDDLLVGDEARAAARSGSARGRCRPPPAISSAVRFAVPEGASSLPSWWSSTISHSGMCAATRFAATPSSARRRSRSSGRRRQFAPSARAPTASAQVVEVEARWCRRPRGRRRRRQSTGVRGAVSGVVKSTTTSASPRTSRELDAERRVRPAGELEVVGALDRLADGRCPSGPRRRRRRRGSCRRRAPGSPAPAAARKRSSSAPMQAAESCAGS